MNTTDRSAFGYNTTADEVLEGIDLQGRRILITGATSGIGVETAHALASKGAQIIITARNMPKGENVVQSIKASTNNPHIEVMKLDLASKASIQSFAKEFLSKYDTLDVLINNAGVMACPFNKTEDGFEMQFGTNHLGHFLLTNLITPAIVKGSSPRIVNLSSRGHRISPIVFDDIQFEQREYHKWASYGQSKTANILHAVELEKRLADKGVHAYAVHPGVIETELGRHLEEEDVKLLAALKRKTVQSGAATSVYAATAPELEGKGGVYLCDCKIAEVNDDDERVDVVKTYAVNPEFAQKLWTVSEALLG